MAAATGEGLKQTWQRIPSAQRKQVALLEAYALCLIGAGEDQEAEKLLSQAIKSNWEPRLVTLYGRLRGRDPARCLKLAESWLKAHQEDPTLLLCLGRLSLRYKNWSVPFPFFCNARPPCFPSNPWEPV